MFVFSITTFIRSISLQGIAQLTRNKDFHTLMKISLLTSVLATLLTLLVAYNGGGIWTFNVAFISRVSIYTLLVFYYTESKYKIAKYNTIKMFTAELKFGLGVFIGRILNGFFNSMDKLILGSIISPESLGQYTNPQKYARMTDTFIRMPIGSVIYSYLERYSESTKKKSYQKYAIVLMLLTTMINGLLFLKGDILYLFAFGEKWIEASKFIKYLSLFSMGLIFKGIYTTILMSENKMKKMNIFTSISIFILFINLFIFYIFNLSLMMFVKLFSGSIFVFWAILLCVEFHVFHRTNQFLKYLIVSIIIVQISDFLGHFIIRNSFSSFIIVALFFEALMILILLSYFKVSLKKVNCNISDYQKKD